MRPFSIIIVFAITTIIVLSQQDILKSCDKANNCESDEPELKQFLSTCLKNKADVDQIANQLDNEDIDFNTLFQLPADDIRSIFKELSIKSWHTGLIINKLYDTDGSAVQKHQFIVVLNTKQNEYILTLNENTENVHSNIAKLQQAQSDVNETVTEIKSEIEQYYAQLINILNQQKKRSLQKLEAIKNRKLKLLNEQMIYATHTLIYLQNSSNNLTNIMNDMGFNVAKKQYRIMQLIESSQQSLLEYQKYLQSALITQPKIEYEPKDTELFNEFIVSIDDVLDVDINFRKIEFNEMQITLHWMSELNRLP
eukprot:235401_1